jgi:hypothetical protein
VNGPSEMELRLPPGRGGISGDTAPGNANALGKQVIEASLA